VVYTIHHVSKTCQHISVLCWSNMNWKIGRHVPEETLNKMLQKLPTSPEMCACTTLENFKWQIEPSRQYLHVHINESLYSYKVQTQLAVIVSKIVNRVVGHIILHHMFEMSASSSSTNTSMYMLAPRRQLHVQWTALFRLFTRSWCVVSVGR